MDDRDIDADEIEFNSSRRRRLRYRRPIVCLVKFVVLVVTYLLTALFTIIKCFSKCYSVVGSMWFLDKTLKKEKKTTFHINALLCGLPRSGKTSLLYRMKLGTFIPTIPTACTQREEFDYSFDRRRKQQIRLRIWDVAQPSAARPGGWRHCHWATDCVIFVIDTTARRSISEARSELFELIYEDRYRMVDARFLIFANKQDVVDSMSRKELQAHLALPNDLMDRWKIVGSSAVTGEGIRDGLMWLAVTSSYGVEMRSWKPYSPGIITGSERASAIEFATISSSTPEDEYNSARHSSNSIELLIDTADERSNWDRSETAEYKHDCCDKIYPSSVVGQVHSGSSVLSTPGHRKKWKVENGRTPLLTLVGDRGQCMHSDITDQSDFDSEAAVSRSELIGVGNYSAKEANETSHIDDELDGNNTCYDGNDTCYPNFESNVTFVSRYISPVGPNDRDRW